ncbi:MAG: hypothetical protein MJA83_14770 [Gammaproteobacteria bacterium]|nr:hypothetical protein [Gammaproteobacteria bacterium]
MDIVEQLKQVLPPYKKRILRFLQHAEFDGWRVKVYGLSATDKLPGDDELQAALAVADTHLPRPAVTGDRYGLAILIVHRGREGLFVILNWWLGQNMLTHRAFFAPYSTPIALKEIARDDPAYCVWEMGVLQIERQAWIDCVLANPDGPDIEAYYARTADTEV